MIKRRLLVALALILALSIALLSVAILITRPETPVSIISTSNCNSNQTSTSGNSSSSANACHKRLLVFSKTGGFRHASIPDAIRALKMLAAEHAFRTDFTEDATVFNDANLSHYDALIFLLTTGEILNGSQKAAFERYIRSGGAMSVCIRPAILNTPGHGMVDL